MKRTLRLFAVASLTSELKDGKLVAFNVGPDGMIYLVVALNPLDYVTEQPGGTFPKTVPDRPQRYRVLGLSGARRVLDVVVENEPFNIHDIQPVRDELLLVCVRSLYRGPEDFERNGRVYAMSGRFEREILLGDGIQSVQATSDGVIWTSFFDEGIFGNYGWSSPIGASGLIAWDSDGNKLYEFEPARGVSAMDDCYALNVESDNDVWCYYYSNFPLVHLRGRKIAAFWKTPVNGSDAFAVSAGLALFRGGYKNRDTYQLLDLGAPGEAKSVAEIELRDEQDAKLVADRVVGRADTLYLLCQNRLFKVDVRTSRDHSG